MKRIATLLLLITLTLPTMWADDNNALPTNTEHGIIIRLWYEDWPMCVYLPPKHKLSDMRQSPVLYLLSGTGDSDWAWLMDGGASDILDRLYTEKKLKPMVVVMPLVDAEMDGEYEERFPDLVRYVERCLHVSKIKKNRAIAGLSIGGFHAMHIAHNNPQMFDYVGIFSAIFTTEKMEIFKKDVNRLFPTGEQVPEPYNHVEEEMEQQMKKAPKVYFVACGRVDFLYRQSELFRQYLDLHDYAYEYYESKGGHSWDNWQDYLERFLPLLFQK